MWEVSFAPDGRATFSYGDPVRPGEPHVIWRRLATTTCSAIHKEVDKTGPETGPELRNSDLL